MSDSKVYKVDTSSALNANYVSEESNKSAKTLEDLKVSAPTLIKISGDEIVKYYEKERLLLFKITEEIDEFEVKKIRRRADYEIERYMPKR